MDRHSDFFDFVSFVLCAGDDAAVRAFDRALSCIGAQTRQSLNACLHPNLDQESGIEMYSEDQS